MKTLKILRKAFAVTALPLLLATAATTQVGCLGHSGPTEVAQGRQYQSGEPTYDQFFTAVHELQLEMGQAPDKEAKLRLELGKQLGVEPEEEDTPAAPAADPAAAPKPEATAAAGTPSVTDAYSDQLKKSAINAVPGGAQFNAAKQQVEQAKQTVNQLKGLFGGGGPSSPAAPAAPAKAATPVKKAPKPPSATMIAKALKKKSEKLGLEMKLDVDHAALDNGDGTAELRLGNQEPNSDAKEIADKVEQTAKAEVELITKMRKAQKKLDTLEKMSSTLQANVTATFRTSRAKMSDVSKNLDDATALIKLMQTRAVDVDKKAQTMLSRLEDAASADVPKPGDEAKKDAVASNDSSDTQASDETKKEESDKARAAEKARADKARAEENEKAREEARRAKKDAAEKEAEARRLKKELAEKEAEAKRAKKDAEKKEKALAPRQTSSAKPAPGKSAMNGDFEP